MDVVYVVGVSKAMVECMDMVKERIINFLPNFTGSLAAVNKTHSDIRVRIISYRILKRIKKMHYILARFIRLNQF